jgi:hypothetical protein
MIGTFIATVLGVSSVVYINYPDRVSYPREFEGGLERELGGPGALRVRLDSPCVPIPDDANETNRRARRVMRTRKRNHIYCIEFPLCTCNLGRVGDFRLRPSNSDSFCKHGFMSSDL